jgi:hypothetical protein
MSVISIGMLRASIAIDNPRLLNKLRESLQQQTATSEVLGRKTPPRN